MRKYSWLFTFVIVTICLIGSTSMNGQELSKSEAKKWKKIAKNYTKNPAALKTLTEEHRDLKRSSTQGNAELTNLKRSISDKNTRIQGLESEIMQLRSRLSDAQSQMQNMSNQPVATESGEDISGVWFKVQIGAYEERRIDQDLQTSDNFVLEDEGSLQKIIIGKFRNFDDADRLRSQLQGMGVSDAWVVAYQDGNRVPVEDVRN